MKVLLTGATGLVGKNVLEAIHSQDIICLTPSRKTLDLCNYKSCFDYIQETQPDIIIHCAGLVGGIQANIKNQDDFLYTNTMLGLSLIKASFDNNVNNFLNLGSSCIYPRNLTRPIQEIDLLSSNLEVTNEGYALAKITCLKYCQYISNKYPDYHYKTIIPCNLYGKYDKFDPSVSHLVPSIIHKLSLAKLENSNEVLIWGDGKARREFMYAGDLARIIVSIIPKLAEIPDYINIGIGIDYTISEYYEKVAKLIGWQGEFKFDVSKPVGMKRKLLDTSLQNHYGLQSSYQLETGLLETIDFYNQLIS